MHHSATKLLPSLTLPLKGGGERTHISRRHFITFVGFAAVLIPTTAGAQQAPPASDYNRLVVAVPHHLTKLDALRRLKSGLASLQRDYGYLFTIQDEKWTGYHLVFRASVLGQPADGTIDVANGSVDLNVALPWLLAPLARAAEPLIVQEGVRMLERKSQ
jgi:hypothetical protein